MPSAIIAKRYGFVSPNEPKQMSGLGFVQGLANNAPHNRIAQTQGYDITEAENGRVVLTAEPRDTHLNPVGTVHGGLAPRCSIDAWDSPSSRLCAGSTTLEFKISFVRPSRARPARSVQKAP